MRKLRKILILFLTLTSIFLNTNCNGQRVKQKEKVATASEKAEYKVTFIELGSVRCIPCQQMQPVMKSIEKKYAGQVNVVFHDVWTEEGKPYATKYGIESIPTQVFLDSEGKEFFRHVGYFPKEELIKVLKQKGVE